MNDTRRRAVFLDRDGTIVEDADYLNHPDQLRLLPGAAEALRALREAGLLLLVVTNQSAIARGWLTEEGLHQIHRRLDEMLAQEGAAVDAYYHCPHLPDGEVARYAQPCDCRKPAPGLIERAAREWCVELGRSYAVGDSERDVEAGRRAGCFSILIGEGPAAGADAAAGSLKEAAALILERDQHGDG